jgi:hypothetical protein
MSNKWHNLNSQRNPFRDSLKIGNDNLTLWLVSPAYIHDQIHLPIPEGYEFQIVSADIKVSPFFPVIDGPIKLCSSGNIAKCVVSIIQLLYAIITLYCSRDDQITRYDYAAFGLTLIRYATMSLVNLVGNILTPHYTCFYMVRSEVMLEAERRGGQFDDIIGKIDDLGPILGNKTGLHFEGIIE